jgi:hypothetical protein
MATISNLNVEVGDQDTVIIDSTETATNEDRIFGIGNGENEIIAKVWGSNDNQNWEEVDNKPIPPQGYENIIMGHGPQSFLLCKTYWKNIICRENKCCGWLFYIYTTSRRFIE